jgi:16S rRNA (guanine527-N7)-methyltransferase
MQHSTIEQSFFDQLSQACASLSLTPTQQQKERLLEYINQLIKWNKTYNLTAIRLPEQALVQHIFDSLAVIQPLTQYLFQSQRRTPKTVLDVGSGAGIPGVIIAIMIPEASVTCIDTVEKKMTFVRQVRGVLSLTNLHAVHQRVELFEGGPYDVVISRAFASLQDFVTLAGNRVNVDAKLLAMKGKEPHDEIRALDEKTTWYAESIEALSVPQLSAQRCLVWLKRKGK